MTTTLSIETTSIRVLNTRGKRVEKWASAPLEAGIVRDGVVRNPQALGQAVDALFRQTAMPRDKVVVGIAGLHSAWRIITLPKLKAALMDEAVRRAAKKEMPVPLEELHLRWRSLGEAGEGRQSLFVLGVPREAVDTSITALGLSGIKPSALHLKPLTLTRAIGRSNALIIDLESDSFIVTLVSRGVPVLVRTVAPRGGEATLGDNIRRLLDEIARTVQFHNRGNPASPIPPDMPMFLTGDLASEPTAASLLSTQAGYPLQSAAPPLACASDFPLAAYAANLGLAMMDKSRSKGERQPGRSVQLDFLAVKQASRPRSLRRVALGLAVLGALAGLLPGYLVKQNAGEKLDALQSELAGLEDKLQQSRLAAQEEQEIGAALVRADTLRQTREAVFPSASPTAAVIQMLLDALPAGAQISGISLDRTEIRLEGTASTPSAAIDYALTLDRLGSFAEVSVLNLDETNFSIGIRRPNLLPSEEVSYVPE